MNILLNTLRDPIWQVLALVITLAAPVLIVAVRTRDVHATAQQKRRDTLTILRVWLATFLLMSGVALALHLPDAAPRRTSSTAPSPVPTMAPTPSPTSTPTSIPTPTPTPRLAHSMTQALTTFRFGRSGEVDFRFTMGVQDKAWMITGVCDIMSEGCFAVSWG
jgi:hypothetical protein